MNERIKELCGQIAKENYRAKLTVLIAQLTEALALDHRKIAKVYIIESRERAS